MSSIPRNLCAGCGKLNCFLCPICKRCFPSRDKLKLHVPMHPGIQLFICKSCPLTFTDEANLVNHDCLIEVALACKYCGKLVGGKVSLDRHVRDVCRKLALFHCSICPKSFKRKSCLEDHERWHTGEKPFECAQCGKLFISLKSLRQHTHHTCECAQCGKLFASSGSLRQHMLIHMGIQHTCPVCSKVFSRKYRMVKHCQQIHPESMDDVECTTGVDVRIEATEEGSTCEDGNDEVSVEATEEEKMNFDQDGNDEVTNEPEEEEILSIQGGGDVSGEEKLKDEHLIDETCEDVDDDSIYSILIKKEEPDEY